MVLPLVLMLTPPPLLLLLPLPPELLLPTLLLLLLLLHLIRWLPGGERTVMYRPKETRLPRSALTTS